MAGKRGEAARSQLIALIAAFSRFDEDSSGTISSAEMLTILTEYRAGGESMMTLDDAREVISDFDRNGDGVLDISEFVTFLMVPDVNAAASDEFLAFVEGAYKQLDTDGDGIITADEVWQMLEAPRPRQQASLPRSFGLTLYS